MSPKTTTFICLVNSKENAIIKDISDAKKEHNTMTQKSWIHREALWKPEWIWTEKCSIINKHALPFWICLYSNISMFKIENRDSARQTNIFFYECHTMSLYLIDGFRKKNIILERNSDKGKNKHWSSQKIPVVGF